MGSGGCLLCCLHPLHNPGQKGHEYSGPKVHSFLFSTPLFSQTNSAEKRTNGAEKRTNGAEKRTNGAEKRTTGAEKRTNGAEKRTNGAEKRKCTLGPPYSRAALLVEVIIGRGREPNESCSLARFSFMNAAGIGESFCVFVYCGRRDHVICTLENRNLYCM